MTEDELNDILSDVTTLLGTALTQHVELREGLEGAGVECQSKKLDALKLKLAVEKDRLKKLKDATSRKRELERLSLDHERQTARSAANRSHDSVLTP